MQIGRDTLTITHMEAVVVKDKDTIKVYGTLADGEETHATIWMTERGMGMARAALKVCGYDPDTMTLAALDENPTLLAGRQVPVMIEEYNGQLSPKIEIANQKPNAARLQALDQQLRAAKGNGKAKAAPAMAGDGPPPIDDSDLPF